MTSTDTNESHDIESHNERLLALGPLDPAEFPFTEISPPLDDSAKCKLTLTRTGTGDIPQPLFIHGTAQGTTSKVPVFAFLIERMHKDRVERVLFELGLREVRIYLDLYHGTCSYFEHSNQRPSYTLDLQAHSAKAYHA